MDLDPDVNECATSFIDDDVRLLVVGGYVFAAHGLPQYTGALDAWVRLRRRVRRPVGDATDSVARWPRVERPSEVSGRDRS